MISAYLSLILIIYTLLVVIRLFVLYFIIKKAVRNGILEAHNIIQEEEDCIK